MKRVPGTKEMTSDKRPNSTLWPSIAVNLKPSDTFLEGMKADREARIYNSIRGPDNGSIERLQIYDEPY